MPLIEKYAFRACTINDNSVDAVITGPCYACKKELNVLVRSKDLENYRRGEYAQECFKYLKPGEREFLISGICDSCWQEMFPPDEEEETTPED